MAPNNANPNSRTVEQVARDCLGQFPVCMNAQLAGTEYH
jgi:hypothetical protein